MNVLLAAALQEFDLLQFEKEDCEEIAGNKSLPEVSRAAADIRLATLEVSMNMCEGIIMAQLERMPVAVLLESIENNLSDKWN